MPTKASRLPVRPQWLLLGVALVAAVVVVIAATASSSGAPSSKKSTTTVSSAPAALMKGIPEHGGVLGAASAPVTITEFVDPQCPICKASASADLPTIVNDYVRTGKVKLRAEVLQFIGPDSVTAARYAAGAAQQSKLWPFLATLYGAQGEENSGYMTPAFLRSVAKASGVDAAKAGAYASTGAAGQALNTANALAKQLGVNATPTFVAQRGNGALKVLGSGEIDPSQVHSVLDKAIAK